MDNKITKRRLGNFLSYEWIVMIIVAVISIVVFEFVYGIMEVKPTTGQEFKVYYDENFSYSSSDKLYELIEREDTLSYDVLKKDYEILFPNGEANILNIRLSVYEGDIIISDFTDPPETATEKKIRSEYIVDTESVYTLDKLLADAKSYLKTFLKEGESELKYENLDTAKIDAKFLERMKKDNRFRKDQDKENGKILERKRIEKLCNDVSDFEKFLTTAPENCFYRYTKYTCLKELRAGTDLGTSYELSYQKEIAEGRENAIYGIHLGGLTGGKTQAEEYFKVNGASTANKSVMMAFNFLEHQPELQFECISFMCTVIRECSDII